MTSEFPPAPSGQPPSFGQPAPFRPAQPGPPVPFGPPAFGPPAFGPPPHGPTSSAAPPPAAALKRRTVLAVAVALTVMIVGLAAVGFVLLHNANARADAANHRATSRAAALAKITADRHKMSGELAVARASLATSKGQLAARDAAIDKLIDCVNNQVDITNALVSGNGASAFKLADSPVCDAAFAAANAF